MKVVNKLTLVAVFFILAAAAPMALAHNWGCFNQPSANVTVENDATVFGSETQTAIDEWNDETAINITASTNADVYVFDANSGYQNWGGLATIYYTGCTINYCTAQLNTYFSWTSNEARGVQCQEVGHCWGLDHSNDGGCMGGGYYYDIGVSPGYTVVEHNTEDMEETYGDGGGGSCSASGASCSSNSDCCSNSCRGRRNSKTCRGDGFQAPGPAENFLASGRWLLPDDLTGRALSENRGRSRALLDGIVRDHSVRQPGGRARQGSCPTPRRSRRTLNGRRFGGWPRKRHLEDSSACSRSRPENQPSRDRVGGSPGNLESPFQENCVPGGAGEPPGRNNTRRGMFPRRP